MSLIRKTSAFLLLIFELGCGDKVTVNETVRGAEGESCRSRNDCAEGLMCLDMICRRAAPMPAPGTPMADAGTIKTRSELGESCQTRADCLAPLACIDNTCLMGFAPDAGPDITAPTHGKRGESCQASNDCDSGLACIGGRCLESDFDLVPTPKQCYRVQCQASADCCKDWKPAGTFTPAQCDMMKANCESSAVYPPAMPPGLTFNDCLTWVNSCRCTLECMNEQCAMVPGAYCLVDEQCFTGPAQCRNNRCVECVEDTDCLNALRPFCTANACVQCGRDADCPTAGSRCVASSCQAGCTANEHCAQLESCQMGECVDTGCTTDRQCYFLTGDDRSHCVNKKCQTPCAADAECLMPFHICADGVCAFAGCESDEECRAVLKLENQSSASLDRAVCRVPPTPTTP